MSKKITEIDISGNRLVFVDNLIKNVATEKANIFLIGVEDNRLVRAFNQDMKDDQDNQMMALTVNLHGKL